MAATAWASISPKIQNILFTTDFSSCSDNALPYARAIAGFYGATVHVVHVIRPKHVQGEFGFSMPEVDERRDLEMEALAHERMDRLTRSEAFKGLLHTQVIEKGTVWDVVTKLVDSLCADLIILGTHGRHGFKHLMLGSVAEQIFRRAACPVLTVGPEIRKNGMAAGKLATILFATDFSPASRRALDYALLLARTAKAKISLLHVITEYEATGLAYDEARIARIRQQLAGLMPDDPMVMYEASVETGTPANVICDKAAETRADLIVMGAHRGAAVSAHAPWAVAHRVVCEAPSAVLTVRG